MRFALLFAAIFVVFAQIFVRPQTNVISAIKEKDDPQTEVPHHEEHEEQKDAKEQYISKTDNNLVKKIQNLLESLKNVTDPIAETNWRYDIPENPYMNGKLEMVVVFLFGHANVTLSKFSYDQSTSQLQFTLTWDGHVVFMTTNNNQVTVGNNTDIIEEKSQIRIVLTGLQMNGTAIVGDSKISELSLVTNLKASLFTVSGLLNDSFLSVYLANALTKYFPTFLENNVEIVSRLLSPIVETVINLNL